MRRLLWLTATLCLYGQSVCSPLPALLPSNFYNYAGGAVDILAGYLGISSATASTDNLALTPRLATTLALYHRQNNNDCVTNCGTDNINGGNNNTVSNGSGGTNTTDRNIALGIGLGVGLPGAIVATYQILKFLSKRKKKKEGSGELQKVTNGGLGANNCPQQNGEWEVPWVRGPAELEN